jgi:glycogen debranching enzyme
MAAQKSKEVKDKLFEEIIYDIAENGKSLMTALKGRLSSQTFYAFIDNDPDKTKRYARACDDRAEKMADEILEIADNNESDIIFNEEGQPFENQKIVQRDRLRVDSRKWLLAKLHPKKYGDKIAVESEKPGKIDELQEEKLDLEIKKLRESLGIE